MTGLTDAMRANFQLMKEMSQTTHADARRRVQECKALLDSFAKNEKCKTEMDAWQISIDSEPQSIEGQKLSAGRMVMGK
jgi:aubergine